MTYSAQARRWLVVAVSAVAALVALTAVPASASAQNECVRCHGTLREPRLHDPAVAFRESVHARDEVGCAGCHGGDPADPTVRAHSPDLGFRPRPSRTDVPLMCGGCHGDARFIRRFSGELPTDQLTLWQVSRHGTAAARGDLEAPVCTDCHGSHDVLRPSDSRSPANPQHVAAMCGRCHADPGTMEGAKLPTDQLASWQRSAHAAALAKGIPRAPSCSGCHGGHGEQAAATGTTGLVCAGCHREEATSAATSPHKQPFTRLGFTACVPCHGKHDVTAAGGPEFVSVSEGGACARCHAHDEKPKKVADELRAALQEASTRAIDARARATAATAAALKVPGIDAVLADLRAAEVRLGPVLHSLDSARLATEVEVVTAIAADIDERVSAVEGRRRTERTGYYAATGVVGLLFALLFWKAMRLSRRRRRA